MPFWVASCSRSVQVGALPEARLSPECRGQAGEPSSRRGGRSPLSRGGEGRACARPPALLGAPPGRSSRASGSLQRPGAFSPRPAAATRVGRESEGRTGSEAAAGQRLPARAPPRSEVADTQETLRTAEPRAAGARAGVLEHKCPGPSPGQVLAGSRSSRSPTGNAPAEPGTCKNLLLGRREPPRKQRGLGGACQPPGVLGGLFLFFPFLLQYFFSPLN